MPDIVAKFGGSSLADAACFKNVAAIIQADANRRYIVVSAPGKRSARDDKVTDLLYNCCSCRDAGLDPTPLVDKITERFTAIATALSITLDIRAIIMNALKRGNDELVSRGEYINGRLLAAYLHGTFFDPVYGIYFDENGRLDEARTYQTLQAQLTGLAFPVVIPGFYGCDPQGAAHVFSRGGSDITGAIVARSVNAVLYENWTDVSGIRMADPRIIAEPKAIDTLTYAELRELTYMGATILHSDAVFPASRAGIPINIRNVRDPGHPGTRIVANIAKTPLPDHITGISGRTGFTAITLEKDRMNSEIGFGRRFLSVLEERNISFEHLATSIDTLSVLVDHQLSDAAKASLTHDIMSAVAPDSILIETNIALIAIVGRGMIHNTGLAARIFGALGRADINIKIIDQDSSELNIIIGVEDRSYEKAIKALYQELA